MSSICNRKQDCPVTVQEHTRSTEPSDSRLVAHHTPARSTRDTSHLRESERLTQPVISTFAQRPIMANTRKPKVKRYSSPAGGWRGLRATGRGLAVQGIPVSGAITLMHMNKPGGFDCSGCAWPDPKHDSPHCIVGHRMGEPALHLQVVVVSSLEFGDREVVAGTSHNSGDDLFPSYLAFDLVLGSPFLVAYELRALKNPSIGRADLCSRREPFPRRAALRLIGEHIAS